MSQKSKTMLMIHLKTGQTVQFWVYNFEQYGVFNLYILIDDHSYDGNHIEHYRSNWQINRFLTDIPIMGLMGSMDRLKHRWKN